MTAKKQRVELTNKEMYIAGGVIVMIALSALTGNVNLMFIILFWGGLGLFGFWVAMKMWKMFKEEKKKVDGEGEK